MKPLPLGAGGAHGSRRWSRDEPFRRARPQPAVHLRSRKRRTGLSIRALRCGVPLPGKAVSSPRLRGPLCGLDFPNPLGMAAGYDKNAEVPDALLRLGFGFAEIGTVTPLPQPGNPQAAPLPADRGRSGHQPARLQQ